MRRLSTRSVLTDQMSPHVSLAEAFSYCRRLALRHRENFTVASWLLPRRLRPHMYAIYAYCRIADDIGDEVMGDRLAQLDDYKAELRRCYDGKASKPSFVALQSTIHEFDIPIDPFLRLIEANRRDQRVERYGTFEELLEYCSYSANPVGQLVLYLFRYRDGERQRLSDATCTGLQLANFWQDVSVDLAKGRIYIPLEDMARFDYTERDLLAGRYNEAFKRLIAFEISRTRQIFADGVSLIPMIAGRLRLDLRLFTLGGLAVLDAIERADYAVLTRPPRVSRWRKLGVALRGIVPAQIRVVTR